MVLAAAVLEEDISFLLFVCVETMPLVDDLCWSIQAFATVSIQHLNVRRMFGRWTDVRENCCSKSGCFEGQRPFQYAAYMFSICRQATCGKKR